MDLDHNIIELRNITNHEEFSEPKLSAYEKAVFFMIFAGVLSVFIIGLWSGVILYINAATNNGPLALLMKIVPTHLLL